MSKTRPDPILSEPVKKLAPLIEYPGGTPRLCGNCQYFKQGTPIEKRGHCHNLISGNWRVNDVDTACRNGFYPDVVRFPIHVLMGIVPATATE